MKTIKIAGLALTAALALMALAGAAPASATTTTICATGSTPCPAGDEQPAGAFEATSGDATIETSSVDVACGESTLAGESTAAEGAPLAMKFSGLSMDGCHIAGSTTKCTVTELRAPSSGSLAWTGEGTGDLEIAGGESGWEAKVKCGSFINCTMAGGISLEASGSGLQAVDSSLEKKSGLICPSTMSFAGAYSVDEPSPFYVSHTEAGTHFSAESSAVEVQTSVRSFTCNGSIEGELGTSGSEAESTVTNATWNLSGCESGGSSCTTNWSSGISQWNISWLEPQHGWEADGVFAGEGDQSWSFNCPKTVYYDFVLRSPEAELISGSPAKLVFAQQAECVGGNGCSGPATFSAEFTVTDPQSL